MNFGEKIKQYRVRNRLTLRQFSKLAGVSYAALNRFENGLGNPRPKTVDAINLAMKLTPEEIDEKLNVDVQEPVNPDNNMHPDCMADVAYELLKLRELIERYEYLILTGLTFTVIASVYILVCAIKRG